MNYYELSYEEFSRYSNIPFNRVNDLNELNTNISREIGDLIKRNNEGSRETSLILPVGPLDYTYLAEICNKERIDLGNLQVYMMDEYLDDQGKLITEDHPLSFRRHMRDFFVANLDAGLDMSMERIVFPDPDNIGRVTDAILDKGGVDACYGGFGITGHFAFNDPPEPGEEMTVEDMRNTTTRVLTISRESSTQMAMGGTHGNWEILPRQAVTLGMKELLASRHIHLTFMRDWHAGIFRRALFGPVNVDCPGSLIQEHSNVRVTLTRLAAKPPVLDVSQETGE